MTDITRILDAIERGDPQAADQLLPLVYDELRKFAGQKLAQEKPGQTLQATALVHEAYLRLVGTDPEQPWNSRGHFFAAAAEAMRRILVENARRKASLKRGGDMEREELLEARLIAPAVSDDLVALDEALTQLAAADALAAALVKLRYFAGLTSAQAAEALGISARTADRTWVYARTWLLHKLQQEIPLPSHLFFGELRRLNTHCQIETPWQGVTRIPVMNERSIFAAALDIADAAERATFLDQVCGDDAELRRHLDELLAAQEKLGSFLAQPLPQPQATIDCEPITERPGTVIGPYRLMEQIGEGGMGLVFVAEQQQPMRRKVALKLIKPGMDSREVIARFEAERQALALLDHPNIARVLDAGATDSGRPYFVMELVKGVPITDYCDQNQLTPRERLRLFVSVCQAVQHAHTKGIIHRDLKPSNVLVTLHDGTPVAKVIDFGVAKAIGQRLTDKTIYTRFAQMIGTPLYMSPEQAEMSGLDIDTRSDVYSLGVLLYELLTGTTPFDRERLQKAAFDEIRRIIREEEPPRPSTRLTTLGGELTAGSAKRKTELGKLSALVRGDLDWIVMKGLDKDRTRRYETASALAQDVQHYLADEPVLAGPPSAGYRLRKFVKRNRGPALAAGVVLLAVLAGVAGTTWGWVEAVSQRDDAVQARTEEAEQRQFALENAAEADEERLKALGQKNKADLARQQAQANETKAEWRLYASNIASAQREWETDNPALLYHYLGQCRPDLRGWEHDYLYTLANQNQQTLGEGGGFVDGVAFSPDGNVLAIAGDEGVRVWDTTSGREVFTFKGQQSVFSVAFSADGKMLATAAPARVVDKDTGKEFTEHVIRLWDVATRKEARTLQGLAGMNSLALSGSVSFSPDGKRLACCGGTFDNERGWLELFDVATGQGVWLEGPAKLVAGVAFSPDGKRLAGASWDGTAKVWDLASQKVVLTFKGHTDKVQSVAFSPDGKRLASASRDKTVQVWDAASGKEILTLKGHTGFVLSVVFSPDGKRLASASGDGTVKVWDAADGQEVLTLRGHIGLFGVAFSPDGKRLATVGDDRVKLWATATAQQPLTLQGHAGQVKCVTFTPDGKRLASGGWVGANFAARTKSRGELKVWDASSGQEIAILTGHIHWLDGVAFSPNGKLLAGASYDKTVKLWDAASGQEVHILKGHTRPVRSVAFSPEGSALASASGDRTVKVWDVASGREVMTLTGHINDLTSVAFSHDGRRLASAAWDGTVKVWDRASGRELLSFTANPRPVDVGRGPPGRPTHSVAFSPDGKRLASGSDDNMVKLWDATSGQELLTLKGHLGPVRSLAFSPDGKRLGSASDDRTIKLWDADSGQELLTLKGHTDWVQSVAFSRDGKRLASASRDGTIKIWDASKSLKEADRK